MFFEARGLSYAYGCGQAVFEGLDLALERGQVCTVLGPNGTGKTTLLNCLGAYLSPKTGTIVLDGRPLMSMSPTERASRVGFVAQLQDISVDLEVRDYLVLGRAMRVGLLRTPAEADYRRAELAMETFGIGSMAGRSLAELSGGERQQVEIARVLVQDSELVLMDEPTNHLDYANQVKVLSMVRRLAEQGRTVVLTSHAPDHALALGGTVALMERGGALEVGPPDSLCTPERLSQLYGCDVRAVYVPELGRTAVVTGRIP